MQSQMLPVLMHPCLFLVSCSSNFKAKLSLIPFFVIAAPMISVPTDSQEFRVHERTSITIVCAASGYQAPTLSYFRGTDMLTNSGRIQIVEGKAQPAIGGLIQVSLSFILSNAEDADSGEFSCVASTDIPAIGSLADTVNFNITVLGKNRVCTYIPACIYTSNWAKCMYTMYVATRQLVGNIGIGRSAAKT